MRDLGFDEVVGWSFTDPGEPGRLRIPPDDGRASRNRARQPALRGPVGDADDAARLAARRRPARTSPAAPTASPSSSPAASTSQGRRREGRDLAGEFPGERPAPFHEPHRIAALAVGPLAPASWRGGGEPADFFALKGVLEALAGAARRAALLRGRRASRSCTPAAPARGPSRRRAAAGWIGEVHPLVCRAWDLEAAAGFEIDLAALLAAAAGRRGDLRGRDQLPGRLPGPGGRAAGRDVLGRASATPSSRPAASCCARPRSSTSTRASSSARAARAWRCGSSSAPPTAPSPTRRSPACAARSRRALGEIGGTLRG